LPVSVLKEGRAEREIQEVFVDRMLVVRGKEIVLVPEGT